MYQQQKTKYQISPREINLILHFREEEIPLVIYPGTSEQAIFENIRDLTNLYRFRCLDKKQRPIILSSNLPNKTHIFIQDPTIIDQKEESDEPTPEQQVIIHIQKHNTYTNHQNIKYIA